MGYEQSRILFQMLCVGILVMSISNGCQLSTSSNQCQPGWFQVEQKCILLPNTSVDKHEAAADGCKRLGVKLLSDPISDQVKECILSLITGKSSTEIWIDMVGRKSQHCGTINLTSQHRRTVTCNQTVTIPRIYVCESNSSSHQTTSKETDCPVGFERIHRGCYKFGQDELDWDEAFTSCKESNGDLSEIISRRERDDFQKHLASHYPSIQSWWMGLKRQPNTEWAWLDGTGVDPNMIPWNNPALRTMKRELCGTIETKDSKFLISGTRCSMAKPFICEYHAITVRPAVNSTTPELPIQDSGANTDMASSTTLTRKQTEVSTTNPSGWIATMTSTATPRADVKASTTSEVTSTTKQTVLVREPTKEAGDVSATSLPEQKKDPWIDGEQNETPATSAVPLTSTTAGATLTSTTAGATLTSTTAAVTLKSTTAAVPLTSTTAAVPLTSKTSESLLTTSSGKHVTDKEGNHTQNSSTGTGMAKPRPTHLSTVKSTSTAAPLPTTSAPPATTRTTPATTRTTPAAIVFCPEDRQEEVTFVQTRGGVTLEVPCPPNYEGNITRTCDDKTGSWTPFSQYNCTRNHLVIASNLAKVLSNESTDVLEARVKNISSEVTSALASNITIVSDEIKQIVNILEQIGQASDRSVVSNETLQSLAAITDKLIEADTSTWDELSTANKTENAGSVLMKAMEDITSSYLQSGNVTDTLIVEKNIVITVASTGKGKDNITFPKMDHATYNTNQSINKVFLSSEALSGPVSYSVIIYTNVSDKFKVYSSSDEPSQQQRIGSDVISFSLSSKSTSLSPPLILTFKTGESRHGAVCSYLDTKSNVSGVWLTDGCKTILKETAIDCLCSHLTNFAVLMSMTELELTHHTILSYVSIIGISISLFCLCLTVTVYLFMWRYVKSDRSVLHINLCVCLMLGYTVFLGGISKTEHRVACAVAAALLHYLFLAVFFVMLSQGLLILNSVTSVSSVSILRYLYILVYGAPLVIVATSLGITQGEGFGTDKACWLSPQTGVLWAFVGPALSIVAVNFLLLFAVMRIMQKTRFMADKNITRKTKSVVRTIFILSPILGVTWVLGVLSVTVDSAIFQYCFAICNSLQGLFIFISQCVLQHQIKDGFRALLRRYRATSFDSSQRMVSTGQSQEKGYSETGQKTTSITNTSGSYKSKE